ncbi:L,D-transpeptidase [Staphylospora marina]|uniref:L,D-transpeptidase n=1 Tax=Staphylospora marina TaxID=2490858 RepID=UPI003B968974
MYSIVINRARFRLTLYRDGKPVRSWPVAVGRLGRETPTGTYRIINKVPYPYSRPGGRITAYGTMWLGLSRPGYGIHGTNNPASIGRRVSRGCIRMHNRDVEELARLVPIGTPVTIV